MASQLTRSNPLDALEFGRLPLSERSRLFSLPPIGMGTDMTESLSSYLLRLSRAHCVNPRRFIRQEFMSAAAAPDDLRNVARYTNDLTTLDGVGEQAERFAALLSEMTTVPDLRNLTLLPLAGLLPRNGAGQLSRVPRWCPHCIADAAHQVAEMMRPLLWSLDLYRVCHRHHQAMVSACPNCGKEQPYLPAYPDLWHCSHCGTFLGCDTSHAPVTEIGLWVASSLADLVAHLPELGAVQPLRNCIDFLRAAISTRSEGNQARFCQEIGLPPWAMKKWLASNQRPSLPQLLAVAHGVGMPPATILLGRRLLAPTKLTRNPAVLRERAARPSLDASSRRKLQRQLAAIVADEGDTRSLAAISGVLGFKRSCLKYWFPLECKAILGKHAEAVAVAAAVRREIDYGNVRKVVREFAARGEYPGRRKVNVALSRLGCCLSTPDRLMAYRQAIENLSR